MKGDKCSFKNCSELAIGYESHGNYGINVCKDHCSKKLLNMDCGEIIKDFYNYYHKY